MDDLFATSRGIARTEIEKLLARDRFVVGEMVKISWLWRRIGKCFLTFLSVKGVLLKVAKYSPLVSLYMKSRFIFYKPTIIQMTLNHQPSDAKH